jgi:Fur family ferric uptake transcriptional regulator
MFEMAGVVHRLSTGGEFARYELAEELLGHHHHLICNACGSVDDIALPDAVEHQLRESLAPLVSRRRFTVEAHRLDLVGRCVACAGDNERSQEGRR